MALRRWAMALMLISAGCLCNRAGLSTRYGEPVVVPAAADAVPSREAEVRLAAVVMTGSGSGTVRVRNIGTGVVRFTRVDRIGGSEALALALPDARELVSGAEVDLLASFTPGQDADAARATVEHRALFRVDTEGAAPDEGRLTIELVADAVARDCFVTSPLDFGVVPLGHAVTVPLSWTNASSLPQQPEVGAVAGDDHAFFTLQGAAPGTLEPGAQAEVPVRFEPSSERSYVAQVVVRRSAVCPPATVALVAVGSNEAVTYQPVALEFGRLPLNDVATRTVTFTNTSRAELQLSNLAVEGGVFGLPNAQERPLPGQGSVTVSVTCQPTVLGRVTGALTLEVSTTPPRALRIPLGCFGGGPRIRVTPRPTLSFGAVPYLPGTPIATVRRVTVENVGTPPPSANDLSHNLFLGRDGRPPVVSVQAAGTGTAPGEFTVSLTSTWNADAGLPAVVGRNSVDLDVRLVPRSAGPKEATLWLYSNDAVEPTVELRLAADSTLTEACTLAVNPVAVSFGDLPAGLSTSRTLTLVNTHPTAPCRVSGLELAPGSAPVFEVVGTPPTLVPPGASVPVVVALRTPVGAPDGTSYSGYLRFSVNSPATPNVLVPLGARVAQCLVVAPQAVAFGAVRLGCRSSARAINVYNACSEEVRLSQVVIATGPGPFSLVSTPSIGSAGLPLRNGAPLVVQVRYQPTALRSDTGILTFVVDEGGFRRTLTVPLSGEGNATGANTDVFVQPERTPADLLFVVDDSCSMVDEQASLATNFRAFLNYATQRQVPYHIGVTTTDDSPQGPQGALLGDSSNPKILTPTTPSVEQRFATKVSVGTRGSGQEEPLSTALKAVTPPLTNGANSGFLRTGASLSIVVVTDAADQSPQPVSYYLNRFLALAGTSKAWLFSFSVIGPFTAPPPVGCSIDGTVDMGRYDPIISATGGVKVDICTNDWARDLEAIGRVALGPRSTLYLTTTADPTQPVTVTVDGQSQSGWSVDPMTNALIFPPSATPPSGARVEVSYVSACY